MGVFVLSEIVNKVLSVKEQEKIGYKSFNFHRFGNIEATDTHEVVIEEAKSATIDFLEFATNSIEDVYIRITVGTERLYVLRADGLGIYEFNPEGIYQMASGLFDVMDYNPSNNLYKFRLNVSELKCPEGFKIEVRNRNETGESHRCGVYGFGRLV